MSVTSMKVRGCATAAGVLLVLCVLCGYAAGRTITMKNQCSQTLWTSTSNIAGMNNGWQLTPGQQVSINVPDNWSSGRMWARTGCVINSAGHLSCATGDCPLPASMYTSSNNGLYCYNIGGNPPASVIEWTLISGGVDTYDLSLVDGWNIAVQVTPTGSYSTVNNPGLGKFNCGAPVINPMTASQCPAEMRKTDSAGNFIACWSPCKAYHDIPQTTAHPEILSWDESLICCDCGSSCGANCGCGTAGCSHGCSPLDTDPAHANMRCFDSQWPKSSMGIAYPDVFKSISPDAYSWQFDDVQSTYQCMNANYDVTFCPSTAGTCTNFNTATGYDFPNSDIRSFSTSSITDCYNACNQDSNCGGVVLHDNTCWLKTAAAFTAANEIVRAGSVVGRCGGFGLGHCATYQTLTGVDYPFSDITSFACTSMDLCMKTCDLQQNCQGAVMHDGTCWLKTASAFAASNQQSRAGSTVGICGSGGGCSSMTQLSTIDLFGADVANAAASNIDACIALCQANSNCQAATLSGGVCYMKSAAALGNQKYCAGCVSAYCAGIDHCPGWTTVAGTDLFGGDIANAAASSISDCLPLCKANPQCVAATFFNGVCYLKNEASVAGVKTCSGCTSGKCGGNLVAAQSANSKLKLEATATETKVDASGTKLK